MRLFALVELLELAAFDTLAVVCYIQWRRRRGGAAAWLALTFAILGTVVPVGWFTPGTATGVGVEVVRRGLAVLLALFPYCLFRFTSKLAAGRPGTEVVAGAATAATTLATVVIPSVSSPDGGWPWWYAVYAGWFSLVWTCLSLVSVARLWRAGRGQPGVVRRRMRTLGAAAVVLNLGLFVVVGAGGKGSAGVGVAANTFGLFSAVMFLVGFAPPRVLRAAWRRREVDAFREAEADLMGADTAERVATILLPHAAQLVGGRAAVLVDDDGRVRSLHGLDDAEAEQAGARLPVLPVAPSAPGDAGPVLLDGLVAVPVRRGWLAVATTPVTPFFGAEELNLLSTLAHLAGLALDRAELFDRERLGRQALAEREFQLAEAQHTAQLGSYTWDLDSGEAWWSEEMVRILGLQPDGQPDRPTHGPTDRPTHGPSDRPTDGPTDDSTDRAAAFAARIHPDDRPRVLEAWRAAPRKPVPSSIEYRIVLESGETRWIHGRVRPVVEPDGRIVRLMGTVQDITDRKRTEEALAFQASHDALTQLPNRLLFVERLSEALERRREHPSGLAVLFFDLDRFKWLNDSLGHAAGDDVLVTLAARLGQAVRPTDTLARFGGDEFVVLRERLTSEAAAEELSALLRAAVAEPLTVAGEETTLTASVGIAYAGPVDAGETAEAMVRDADAAVYRAKERGRDRHEVFDVTTRLLALARHETANALRRGTERGELVVHYQPQVDITTGLVVGVEALVRWDHPQRGLLAPSQFIALAEETGLIVPLGNRVLEMAARQVVAWQEGRPGVPSQLTVSVNLAPRQLLASDIAAVVGGVLASTGIDPAQLCLEITESVLLDDGEASARALGRLKALGVRVGVDDFGTGFSALTYLKRFPVDVLKIDRSFVMGLGQEREDRAIVASVVDLAHGFGLTTVAEGVETPHQLAELRALGCAHGQGYLWSRPIPADQAATWIATQSRTAARLPAIGPPPANGHGPHRCRVLLVDDDPVLRTVLRLLLEEEDFEVVGEARDGREAVAVARHFRPDVVLLDLAMPGIGGLEALPLIQAVAPEAKVVVLSALDAPDYEQSALAHGAVAYVSKSQNPGDVVSALDALLAAS